MKVPCGTSGGVMIYFDRVEVVNILDPTHGKWVKSPSTFIITSSGIFDLIDNWVCHEIAVHVTQSHLQTFKTSLLFEHIHPSLCKR